MVPVCIRSNTWKVTLDREESTKMESLVIEILNVGGNGSYQGFPKTKDIRITIFFDITVLTPNTGNSPKTG